MTTENRIQGFTQSHSEASSDAITSVMKTMSAGRSLHLDLAISEFSDDLAASIQTAVKALTGKRNPSPATPETVYQRALPKVIRFPYARHSSYAELCHFVEAFRPRDIWPCTEDPEYWHKHGIVSIAKAVSYKR